MRRGASGGRCASVGRSVEGWLRGLRGERIHTPSLNAEAVKPRGRAASRYLSCCVMTSSSVRVDALTRTIASHAQSKQLHRGRLLHHTRDGGDDRAVTAVPVRRFPLQRYYGTVDSLRGARRGARTFRGDARAAPHETSATSGAKPLVDTSRQAPCKLRRRRRGSPRETKTSTPRQRRG